MADVIVEIGAKIDQLISAVDQVKGKLGEIHETTSALSEGFSSIKERILEAFTVGAILEFIHAMGELGLQTERTMAQLGLTAEQTLELGGIAKLTGTSMEGLTLSIERMSLNIQRATSDAFSPAALGLKALGLNAKDLIGLPADAYFDKLHDAVSKFGAGLTTTNAVMAAGGRGVAQMMPLLLLSTDEWNEYKEAVAKARDGLADAIPGMAQTHAQLTLLELSVQSLGARIFSVLQPAISQAVKSMTSFVQSIDADTINTAVQKAVDFISVGVKAIGSAFIIAADSVAGSIDKIVRAFGPLVTALQWIVVGFQGLWDIVKTGGANLDQLAERQSHVNETLSQFRTTVDGFTASLKLSLAPLGGEAAGIGLVEEEAKKAAPAIDAMGKKALEAAAKAQDGIIKMAQLTMQQQKANYDLDVANLQMSQVQKIAAVGAATQEMLNKEIEAEKVKATLYASDVVKKQEALDKIAALEKQKSIESTKTVTETTLAQQAAWTSMLDDITGAWNTQLKGLITGTTTWSAAMKNLWVDLAVKIIEELEKVLIKALAVAAVQAGLNVATGGAAAAGGGIVSALAGAFKLQEGTSYVPQTSLAVVHQGEMVIPPPMAEAIRSGESSLGRDNRTGGIVAGLAGAFKLQEGTSYVSPMAEAKSGGDDKNGGIMAGLAGALKLQEGTPYVAETQMALVHKGEMVIPQSFAEMIRGGQASIGGGGNQRSNTLAVTVNAIDGASVQTWLRTGGGAMIARYFNQNAATRPSY